MALDPQKTALVLIEFQASIRQNCMVYVKLSIVLLVDFCVGRDSWTSFATALARTCYQVVKDLAINMHAVLSCRMSSPLRVASCTML
jgi:hypothetical protein